MKTTVKILYLITFVIFLSCENESITVSGTFYTLSGKVLDSENEDPISNVIIKLNELINSTDQEGNFTFNNLNIGEYNIIINHKGYEADSLIIELISDSSITLNLSAIYVDYFPLNNISNLNYNFEYYRSSGPPRPFEERKSSIASWENTEITQNDSGTIYSVLETRIDSVELYISGGGTFAYQDTINHVFEIFESEDHTLKSEKFPKGLLLRRYIRSDEVEIQYFSNANGFVLLKKNIGITEISHGNTFTGQTTYKLIE